MKQNRTCLITGKSLELFHGNRKIHPEAAKARKDETNRKRHNKVKEINKLALHLDKILQYHYPSSQGKNEINRSMIVGFAWDFTTRTSKGKTPIFWILDYGYSYNTTKDKIIIYDGNNAL
jgi:hypothetical protein